MARVYVNKKSPFFYMSGAYATGKRYYKSTGIPHSPKDSEGKIDKHQQKENNAEALKTAAEYELIVRSRKDIRQKRKMSVDLLEHISYQRAKQNLTIRDYLQHWISRKDGTVADGTFYQIRHRINRFIDWIGERADLPLGEVSNDDIRLLLDRLNRRKLRPSTINNHLQWLDAAFSEAERQSLILINPVDSTDYIKDDYMPRKPLTLEQIEALLNVADEEWQVAILFAFLNGMRLGDSTTRKWSDIDLLRGTICWLPEKNARKIRPVTLPLHPCQRPILETLQHYPPTSEYVTPRLQGLTKPTRDRHASDLFEAAKISREYIMMPSGMPFAQVGYHSLRHSYVSMLMDRGVDQEARMLLAAHSTSEAHSHYTHATVEYLRDKIELLPAPNFNRE